MENMTERDKNEYIKLKTRARKFERLSIYLMLVCFLILIACVILSQKLYGFFIWIGLGQFAAFLSASIIFIVVSNKKIKTIEKKYGFKE
ncbi:MAG: hypothetical protein IJ800_06230 [Clostridia bacterium]|nr:hypothetical protein [Clostridia bacterium]